MTTIVFFENDIKVRKTVSLQNEPIKKVAYYDIFARNDQLEKFVRDLANGRIDDPETAAQDLIDSFIV